MSRTVPFARPDISDREIRAVIEVLESGWITTGSRTREFEERFALRVGAGHAVAVNSCTAALHLALEAVGVSPGDDVIVPTMTFAATGEVVSYLGARPVLVDVLEADHNIDPDAVRRAVTPRTRAIVPVHFAGQACRLGALLAIARSLPDCAVIEDAAHALPAAFDGKTIGSIGDITCFSFYATKTLTTGEGGMATTDNEEWAERMRLMSLHGISKDAWNRYTAAGTWYYEILEAGFKYNLTDIAAALGLVQLDRLDEMLQRRRSIAVRYTEAFADLEGVETLQVHDVDAHAWHLFVIRIDPEAFTIDRNGFIERLRTRGVGTSVHFIPLHLHPHYRAILSCKPGDAPVATRCYERSISLPIYSRMDYGDVEHVIEAVTQVATAHRRRP